MEPSHGSCHREFEDIYCRVHFLRKVLTIHALRVVRKGNIVLKTKVTVPSGLFHLGPTWGE